MSVLFFKKDTELDTKKDTKYDTYRLWGKDINYNRVAFHVYAKIPKGENIDDLKLYSLAPTSGLARLKENRRPLVFFFDDLKNSSLSINPDIDVVVDENVNLHVKSVSLQYCSQIELASGHLDSDEKQDIYIDNLKMANSYESSITFMNGSYNSPDKALEILDFDRVSGFHTELEGHNKLMLLDVKCNNAKTLNSRKQKYNIKLIGDSEKRDNMIIASAIFTFLEVKEDDKPKSFCLSTSSALIKNSEINLEFDKRNEIEIKNFRVANIFDSALFFNDAKLVGPDKGTLSFAQNTKEEAKYFFFNFSNFKFKSQDPLIKFSHGGILDNVSFDLGSNIDLSNISLKTANIIKQDNGSLTLDNVVIENGHLSNPSGLDSKNIIRNLRIYNASLYDCSFEYLAEGNTKRESEGKKSSTTIMKKNSKIDLRLEGCSFKRVDYKDQKIDYTFSEEDSGFSQPFSEAQIIKNTIFEGHTNLFCNNVSLIENSIFKETESKLTNVASINRCEFVKDNEISSAYSNRTQDSIFESVKLIEVSNISNSHIKNYSGANERYSPEDEPVTQESIKQAVTEEIEVL